MKRSRDRGIFTSSIQLQVRLKLNVVAKLLSSATKWAHSLSNTTRLPGISLKDVKIYKRGLTNSQMTTLPLAPKLTTSLSLWRLRKFHSQSSFTVDSQTWSSDMVTIQSALPSSWTKIWLLGLSICAKKLSRMKKLIGYVRSPFLAIMPSELTWTNVRRNSSAAKTWLSGAAALINFVQLWTLLMMQKGPLASCCLMLPNRSITSVKNQPSSLLNATKRHVGSPWSIIQWHVNTSLTWVSKCTSTFTT